MVAVLAHNSSDFYGNMEFSMTNNYALALSVPQKNFFHPYLGASEG